MPPPRPAHPASCCPRPPAWGHPRTQDILGTSKCGLSPPPGAETPGGWGQRRKEPAPHPDHQGCLVTLMSPPSTRSPWEAPLEDPSLPGLAWSSHSWRLSRRDQGTAPGPGPVPLRPGQPGGLCGHEGTSPHHLPCHGVGNLAQPRPSPRSSVRPPACSGHPHVPPRGLPETACHLPGPAGTPPAKAVH